MGVLDSELDSKSDSWTPNWYGPSPCCACFLGSPAPFWCPTCPLWSTHSFLITIKSLGSNLFSRSLADEHKNEFTWLHSCCAHDLVIGPCTSIEGVVVSDVVMSSSGSNPRLEGEAIVKSWEWDFGESGSSSHSHLCYVMFWSDKDCVRKSAPWLVGIGGASRTRKIKFTSSVGRQWLVPRNKARRGFEIFTCLTSLCWLDKLGESCWTLTLSAARFWRLNISQTLRPCIARHVMEHHIHGEALCRVWSC
jgi:hypothetical protein